MHTRTKGIIAVTVGGLMMAGLAVAAVTHPTLTPVAPVREPSVVAKTAGGVIKAITETSITVKTSRSEYTFALDADTLYYLGNGVPTSREFLVVNDRVRVWSLSLTNGTAIKVWDQREYRNPSVTIKSTFAVLKSISADALTFEMTVKGVKTTYPQVITEATKFYTRDGKATTWSNLSVGDAIKIWTMQYNGGKVLSVWDRKIWTATSGTLTKTVSAIVQPALDATPATYGSFTLVRIKTAATNTTAQVNYDAVYDVVGTASTTVEKVVAGAANAAATWSEITNGTNVRVTGLWNDVAKKLYATKIVIQ